MYEIFLCIYCTNTELTKFLYFKLMSCRLVSSSKQSDVITFSVRCGTPEGVLTQQLRAETHRDLALWAQSLVTGCHTSVALQQQLACRKCAHKLYKSVICPYKIQNLQNQKWPKFV